MRIIGLVFSGLLFLTGCSTSRQSTGPGSHGINISGLKLLDEYQVAHKFIFDQTQVGGLSGIDYDPASQSYFIISDDRSAINPIRFYKADIQIKNDRIDTLIFRSVDSIRQPNGKLYPPHRQDPARSADPESIRYNALSKTFIWTSEGERQLKDGAYILQQPLIYEMDLSGHFIDSFFIPGNLMVQSAEKGPRRNSVLEGSSFARNNELLFVSCEEPLLQDGLPAAVDHAGAFTRITKFDVKTKKAIAQFAYPLDAIAHAPKPPGAFAVNGISEILCLDERHLLVVERSFSTGRLINTIKVFIADIGNASNVLEKQSLVNKNSFQPAGKKLLLNTDSLDRYIDNIEGICFGPTLSNGHRSVIMIADDNFNPLEKTQVLLFEVLP